MLGDQYWLFVGICLVGILIGSIVPMCIMLGPMMCGMYLCFRYRMNGIQVRFETLFKGFDVFVNALLVGSEKRSHSGRRGRAGGGAGREVIVSATDSHR